MERSWSEETLMLPDSTSWLQDRWEDVQEDNGPADSTTIDGEAGALEHPGMLQVLNHARELQQVMDEVEGPVLLEGIINLQDILDDISSLQELARGRQLADDIQNALEGDALQRTLEELEELRETVRRRQLPELAAARLPDQSHWSLERSDDQERAEEQ